MLNVEPDNGGAKKVDDYWAPAKRVVLADSNLLTKLMNYDKDNMPAAMVEKMTQYTRLEVFDPALVKKSSVAAAGLCKWVHAMVVYDKVAQGVAPKKAALVQANDVLAAALANLAAEERALEAGETATTLEEAAA